MCVFPGKITCATTVRESSTEVKHRHTLTYAHTYTTCTHTHIPHVRTHIYHTHAQTHTTCTPSSSLPVPGVEVLEQTKLWVIAWRDGIIDVHSSPKKSRPHGLVAMWETSLCAPQQKHSSHCSTSAVCHWRHVLTCPSQGVGVILDGVRDWKKKLKRRYIGYYLSNIPGSTA